MNTKKFLPLLIKSTLILTSIGMLTACGESSDNTYDSSVTSSNSYNSSDYDNDYSEGHSYDKSDPFYSANDVDGNGKLTDEEWQNAMDDAITYYYYKMQEGN